MTVSENVLSLATFAAQCEKFERCRGQFFRQKVNPEPNYELPRVIKIGLSTTSHSSAHESNPFGQTVRPKSRKVNLIRSVELASIVDSNCYDT